MSDLPSTRAARAALMDRLGEARTHLVCGLAMAIPSDEQRIIDHMRDAHRIVCEALAILTVRPDVAEPVAVAQLQAAE